MADYKVCAVYDTETTNIGEGPDTRAYPVLFIVNDLRTCDVSKYTNADDDIRFYRHDSDMYDYIADLIDFGKQVGIVPIVCAYNLMFDLQPLLFGMSRRWGMKANAQTATSAYTVDLIEAGKPVLRFWDTFYLEQNGLAAMGETCGLPKAMGDWNYDLVRTPDTPLTDLEKHYASRDVQVIPAYLRYLCEANEWLKPDMLGVRVITKTSLVRQMARFEIGRLKYKARKGYKRSLIDAFQRTCSEEFPQSFQQYALRKACFRGGFTFTAANHASETVHNVVSLDVTSMHHTFINGRYVPVHFRPLPVGVLTPICRQILDTPLADVLRHYHKPFLNAVHTRIELDNIRLKPGSVFARHGIGLLASAKFTIKANDTDLEENTRAKAAEENVRGKGWHDRAYGATFAYGKLMAAKRVVVHVNEVELWCIGQVYAFDSMRVILGEATSKFTVPPDYVTLQSNVLFARKTDMKTVLKHYREGEPYPSGIPASIPQGIAGELRAGTAKTEFLNAYYNSTVKGMFNGIYGAQAMDLMRPQFIVTNGEIHIDRTTVCDETNFNDMRPKKINVFYNYGMRIVAGSRMHLCIALILLDEKLGERFTPMGGDTDSIKAAVAANVSDNVLMRALKPLADASDNAINTTMKRVRETFPAQASTLAGVGHFDIETAAGDTTRWADHFEAWNKARISRVGDSFHITCAGLARPAGAYHTETLAEDMWKRGVTFDQIARWILGYDIYISHSLCHVLMHHRPQVTERYRGMVTDYLGVTRKVDAPQSIALYPSGRWLGETTKYANMENIRYQQYIGRVIDTQGYNLDYRDNTISVTTLNDDGDYITLFEAEL